MDDTDRPTPESTAPAQAPWHSKSEVDHTVPHPARIYDYFLGESEWFPADRIAAEKAIAVAPFVVPCAQANKAFLARVVRFLSEQGVRQFIDIGCGLPHKDLVHDNAWQYNPFATTLYVDYDTLVAKRLNNVVDSLDLAHKRLGVTQADMREIETILESDETRTLIDFSEPVGLLVTAMLHYLGPGDDLVGLLARYRDALPAGSFFAASHPTQEGIPDSALDQGKKLERFWASSRNPFYYRNQEEFQELFDGWDLVDPGIVWAPQWRPENDLAVNGPGTTLLAGVGKK